MARRFATNLPRSPAYCKTLILSLSRLVQAGRSDQEIADSLNREGILSHTGRSFNSGMVRRLLWGLKHPVESASSMHVAIIRLFQRGKLTRKQCAPLVPMLVGTR